MLLNVYSRFPINFVKGEGMRLYDDQGTEYLDFVSGIAVNGLGHSHPVMVNAIKEQAEKLIHVSNLYYNEEQNRLAKLLTEKSQHERVFFTNSGSEANELAIKIARKYGNQISKDKNIILYMKNSFHGRTTGSLAITGQEKYQEDYRPLMPQVVECLFNDVEDLTRKFNDNVCAIILEPLQGEGGLTMATKEYLAAVESLAKQYKALVIFDEIQCGMGRLGHLFAYETLDLVPDIVTLAKALGCGIPIGACMTRGIANDVLVPGDHGSTYGGNPFVCSVSAAVVNEIANNGVLENVQKMSEYAYQQLETLKEEFSIIEEVRGKGLLLGLKFVDEVAAGDIVKGALEKHLLLVSAGENVVRYIPALIVTKEEIDESISRLRELFKTFK